MTSKQERRAEAEAREAQNALRVAQGYPPIEEEETPTSAEPELIARAREDRVVKPEGGYTGDGTNTGETTPEAGPAPVVTEALRELAPEVPFDAGLRDAHDADQGDAAPREEAPAAPRKTKR